MAHSVLCASLREKIPDVLCLLSAWDSGGGQVSLPVFRGALAALGLVASPLAVARFFAAIGMHARPQRPSGVISLNELEAALQETTFQPPSPRSAPYFGTSLNVAGASWESTTQRCQTRRGGAHTGGGVASHGGRPQSAGSPSMSHWRPTVRRRPCGQHVLEPVLLEPVLQQQALRELREQRCLAAERAEGAALVAASPRPTAVAAVAVAAAMTMALALTSSPKPRAAWGSGRRSSERAPDTLDE